MRRLLSILLLAALLTRAHAAEPGNVPAVASPTVPPAMMLSPGDVGISRSVVTLVLYYLADRAGPAASLYQSIVAAADQKPQACPITPAPAPAAAAH